MTHALNEKAAPLRNPLCIALDVDSREKVDSLVDQLGDIAGGFKIGPRLLNRYGADIVRDIAERAPVFVDCKYLDIPTTMESSVRSAFEIGAALVTVHAQAGSETLKKLAQIEKELDAIRPFRILNVTVLTSYSESNLPSIFKSQPIKELVKSLANEVKSAGLKGIVCSAEELSSLKEHGFYCVTPGIRFSLEEAGDQKRVMGPKEAIEQGASAIVVGRPIIEAKNPREVATDYLMAVYGR